MSADLTPFEGGPVEEGDVLEGISWTGGALPGLLGELQVEGSRLSGVRLTAVELERMDLLDTTITDCELSGAVIASGRWERVELVNCRMSGLVAAGIRARHVRFTNCQADGGWLRAGTFEHCEFADCDFSGADFYEARFAASRFLRCRLDGAELSDIRAEQLALHGSSLTEAKGLATLQGLIIGTDQVLEIALPLLAGRGIVVDDDYLQEGGRT